MKRKLIIRYIPLGVLLLLVWMTQSIPALGNLYSQTVYPVISRVLSFFSNLFPFAIGDLFIFGSITGVIVYPFYARIRKKLPWKRILLRDGEYLLWVYVWFYLAWGLNYSQPNFYQRTHIPYTAYTPEIFQEFVDNYIDSLNSSFVPVKGIHEEQVRDEAVKLYNQLSDSLGVHRPPFPNRRSDGKHGAFLLRIHFKRRLAPHQLSGNVHSRTGSSTGNFERGRGQFLCLSGLYPFTNKGNPFQRLLLDSESCTGERPTAAE